MEAPLPDIALFVEVVRARSFTAAAARVGLTKSAVSKAVTRLEDALGVRLLHRSTRRLALTEEGERLYERCAVALEEIHEAGREASTRQQQPRGRLRIAAPVSFGVLHLAPLLTAFLREHPLVEIDLRLDDAPSDVIGGGFDLALRVAELADSSFVARRLATIRHLTVAAPAYLAERGTPRQPAELRAHDCLVYSHRAQPSVWRYQDAGGRAIEVPVRGRLQADNSLALRAALLDGAGIALTPSFVVGEDVRAGRLVTLFDRYRTLERGLYAILPARRNLTAKTRAFIDFARSRFGDPPGWDHGLPPVPAPAHRAGATARDA